MQDECQKASSLPFVRLRKFILSLRLFPKNHDFFGYFERSAENVVNGTRILCRMIANKDERLELSVKLSDCEHIGDRITREVIDLLHRTFLTPFDRSDIHTLIVRMDDILDLVDYVGKRLTKYNLTKVPSDLGSLAEIVYKSSVEISRAVVELRDLKNCQKILKHCVEANRLENEADTIMDAAIEGVFRDGWDPYQVIKIKELLENIETAADKCKEVANIIEGIILRNV